MENTKQVGLACLLDSNDAMQLLISVLPFQKPNNHAKDKRRQTFSKPISSTWEKLNERSSAMCDSTYSTSSTSAMCASTSFHDNDRSAQVWSLRRVRVQWGPGVSKLLHSCRQVFFSLFVTFAIKVHPV